MIAQKLLKMNMLFKQFMNSFIREGIAITNAEKTKDGFINYCQICGSKKIKNVFFY